MSKKASPFISRNRGSRDFARDRQRAGGPEGDRLAHDPDRCVADPAAVVGCLEHFSEMTGKQDDVLVAVAFDHLQEIVEEGPVAGDRQHGLRHGLRNGAQPRPLAADQNHRLPDRLRRSLLIGLLPFGVPSSAPDAVGLSRGEKDMIERARRHEVDDRRAGGVDMIDPSAGDRTAEEDRHQPIDRLRGARRRLAVSGFGGGDLRLDRFGMRPAAAGGFVHAPVVEQFVDDESFGVEAMPVAKRLQGLRRSADRFVPRAPA